MTSVNRSDSVRAGPAADENKASLESGDDLIHRFAERIRARFDAKEHIKTFAQFLDSVREAPWLHTRNAAHYIKDAFDFFGTSESQGPAGLRRRWRLFDLEFADDEPPVYGQEAAQNALYSHLSAFAERGHSDKIIVLRGPNGTGKSSLIRALMRGLEHYSHQPEGILYTFNWIFSDLTEKSSLGFDRRKEQDVSDSLAHLDAEDISFKINSDLRDNPLLLLPTAERREFLLQCFAAHKRPYRASRHLEFGDISHKSREIYNELLGSYHGDWKRLIQHIQVTRFFVSKRYRRCAVTIEPQRNIDAQLRPLNIESSFQLPIVLHQADIQELRGDLIDGNRGLVEYSDFFKRPLEVNKYLLTTSEQGTISVASTLAYLDTILIATSNEKHLAIFRNDPDFASFKARMEFVRAPYLLQWRQEASFYSEKLPAMARGKDIDPHAAKVLGLFAVLTRLKRPRPEHYSGTLRDLVKRLSAIEKAHLYDSGEAPPGWTDQDRLELQAGARHIVEEFEDFEDKFEGVLGPEYEGRRGISAREMLTIINEASLARQHRSLSGLAIIEAIREICRDKSLYDFLRLEGSRSFGDVQELTRVVAIEYRSWVQNDLRTATDLIDEGEYERLFADYFQHVRAWKTNERLQNAKTGQFEPANLSLLSEVEAGFGLREDPQSFRNGLIMRVASWAVEHPGELVDTRSLFADLFETLRRTHYERRAPLLKTILQNCLKFGTDEWSRMPTAEQLRVEKTLGNLKARFGFGLDCAKEVISDALLRS